MSYMKNSLTKMPKQEKINKIVAFVPRYKVQGVISSLYRAKIAAIKQADADLESIQPVEDEQKILNLYSRLEFVRESLSHYMVKKKINFIKDLFSNKKIPVQKKKTMMKEELFTKVEECLDIVEENVRTNIVQVKEIEGKKQNNNYMISNLGCLPEIKTDLLMDTSYIRKIIGIVASGNLEIIKKQIKDKAVIISQEIDKKSTLIIVSCLHNEAPDIESFLHEIGFDERNIPFENLLPREIISNLKKEQDTLSAEESKILTEQEKLALSYCSLLDYFHEQLQIWKEKIDALTLMKGAKSFTAIELWVPEKNLDKLKDIMERRTEGFYYSMQEDSEAPTLLNNPGWVKPFEGVTGLYSYPKYKDFDPTPILALTFSFFFGFMLTDFVYGLLLLVVGILLIRGKGSYDEKAKGLGIILTMFGSFTLVLGAAFGSYFGDFFQKIGIKMPMLIDPLNQVMFVLVLALGIGALHLLVGLFVGLKESIIKGKALEGIHKQGVWIMLVFAIISFIIQLYNVGYFLLAAALVTQVVLTFKEQGAVPSILSIFGFTGFLGDLFSYGRLMAMAIGTTGIALAVNFMTLMAYDMIPVIGIVAAIIVFIVGHLFNMAMNGLGAFVHSVRLHFLEFFSKFYEGSGSKYVPFGTKE